MPPTIVLRLVAIYNKYHQSFINFSGYKFHHYCSYLLAKGMNYRLQHMLALMIESQLIFTFGTHHEHWHDPFKSFKVGSKPPR